MSRFLPLLVFLVVTAVGVQAAGFIPFKDCGSTSVKFLSVYQQQDAVRRGRMFSGNFTAKILDNFEGGTSLFSVTTEVFGRRISVLQAPKTSMCWLATGSFDQCSFEKGDVVHLGYGAPVPVVLLRRTYTVTFEVWNAGGDRMGCVMMDVPVQNPVSFPGRIFS